MGRRALAVFQSAITGDAAHAVRFVDRLTPASPSIVTIYPAGRIARTLSIGDRSKDKRASVLINDDIAR